MVSLISVLKCRELLNRRILTCLNCRDHCTSNSFHIQDIPVTYKTCITFTCLYNDIIYEWAYPKIMILIWKFLLKCLTLAWCVVHEISWKSLVINLGVNVCLFFFRLDMLAAEQKRLPHIMYIASPLCEVHLRPACIIHEVKNCRLEHKLINSLAIKCLPQTEGASYIHLTPGICFCSPHVLPSPIVSL